MQSYNLLSWKQKHINSANFNPLWRLFFFHRFSGHNLIKIGSFRLPTHRRDAHRKFFWWFLLKIEFNFSVKGDTCVLQGVKGLIHVWLGTKINCFVFLNNFTYNFPDFAQITNTYTLQNYTIGSLFPKSWIFQLFSHCVNKEAYFVAIWRVEELFPVSLTIIIVLPRACPHCDPKVVQLLPRLSPAYRIWEKVNNEN